MEYTDKIYRLAQYAAEQAHFGQTYDIFPYKKHLEDVVDVTKRFGFSGKFIVAAWLHDTIEDGDLTFSKIGKIFSYEVAEMVYAVTDEGKNRKEKKANTYIKLRDNKDAIIVKLCDRIANCENSVETKNQDKYRMYQKEYTEFRNQLYFSDHTEAQALWYRLDEILIPKAIEEN